MTRTWPYLILLLPPLFWAGNFVVGRAFANDLGAITMSFYRWSLAFCILLPFAWIAIDREKKTIIANLPILVILALLSVASFNLLLYLGLRDTDATNALLINSSIPIWILTLGILFYGDSFSWFRALGIAISFIGVFFLVVSEAGGTLIINEGDLWVLSSSMSWALYSLTLRKRPKQLSGLSFLAFIVFVGSIFNGFMLLWNPLNEAPLIWTEEAIFAIAYLALFSSLGAYFCWNYGVAKLGAQIAGQYIHLMPFYGVILAVLFLDESLTQNHILAGILIASGLFLALRAPS